MEKEDGKKYRWHFLQRGYEQRMCRHKIQQISKQKRGSTTSLTLSVLSKTLTSRHISLKSDTTSRQETEAHKDSDTSKLCSNITQNLTSNKTPTYTPAVTLIYYPENDHKFINYQKFKYIFVKFFLLFVTDFTVTDFTMLNTLNCPQDRLICS